MRKILRIFSESIGHFRQILKFVLLTTNGREGALRCQYSSGGGNFVSVVVPDPSCGEIIVSFKQKITPGHVLRGKSLPAFWERIIRRGGKRELGFRMSEENAHLLQVALTKTLKGVEERKIIREGEKMLASVFLLHSEKP
jgi:hypothetical protein